MKDRLEVIYAPFNVSDPEKEKEFIKCYKNGLNLMKIILLLPIYGSATVIYIKDASRIFYKIKKKGFPWNEKA